MSQTKVEAPFVENNATFRNMITNGDMQISQRGTSFASMGNGDTQFTLDRFGWYEEGDHGAAEITITQDTDVPTGQGFAKSLKAVCATVDTSIDAGTIAYVSQKFEGQFLQHLAKGTSSAKSTTLSFWCKSNLTGTFTISVIDQDNTRMFSTSYSPASANTWEKFIINIPADTTGALDNDNASSFRINWNLQAGTNKSNGALASAWEAQAEGDRAVGQTNFYSSTSNNWYITGVQWEVGDAATDFEHLPFDVQLQRCQRYFEVIADARSVGTGTLSSGDSDENIGAGAVFYTTRYGYVPIRFATKKRSNAPSLFITNDTNHFRIYNNGTYDDVSTMTNTGTSSHHALTLSLDNGATGWNAGDCGFIRMNNAAAYVMIKDEL